MMTVIDPAGTPTIVFNRDGTTIYSMSLTGGVTQATAAPIVRYSQWTVVLLAPFNNTGGYAAILPSDSEIGDLIEVHTSVDVDSFQIYPEVGGQINNAGTNSPYVGAVRHILLRKTTSGWFTISAMT
jgi:hypothetical protein